MHKSQGDSKLLRVANDVFFQEVKKHLIEGKEVLFTIKGNSMQPFLSNGDKIIITPADERDFTFGKIILANSAYGYVLHRLVWRFKTNIWLAGDNNLVQLEKVNKRDVLGVVKYALIDNKRINVHSLGRLTLSFIWFLLRPLRLIWFKLRRLL
ncbi:S24/S26 family peptidase [Sphingobacterium composti Ten et al. 2007 non Yoo et al. 2007]|uniref:S24/S26 family peptidase n=1 Tax=Sphingobacterium composti TaxID=363260 RepID=UPI00135ACE88|nr:S24/S26 family peptidase [Sphingobacterium composti Ten et al. 2007 non Yoo et al. 2007]